MATKTPNEVFQSASALLHFARQTARHQLEGSTGPQPPCPSVGGTYGGVFVTFRAGKRLRGCVGRFCRTSDLTQTLREVTKAALGDARFASNPISLEELPALTIEISVLSDLERVEDPLTMQVGTHGILIRHGEKSGCFLPKVAVEQKWSAEQFLDHCCTMKAGMQAGAWRGHEVEVFLFTTHSITDA